MPRPRKTDAEALEALERKRERDRERYQKGRAGKPKKRPGRRPAVGPAFWLLVFDMFGLTPSQIAERIGAKPDSVRKAMKRAIEMHIPPQNRKGRRKRTK